MAWRYFAAAIALAVAVGASPTAQSKPDFSGKWVMVDPVPAAGNPGAPGGGGGGQGAGRGAGFQPGFGPQITIKQDATTLTISRGGQSSPLAYKLDGTESKNTVTRNGQQQEQISTASWDGNTLVIVTQVNFQGRTGSQRRVLTIEGGNLVIDQTNPGRGGGAAIKVVYKKG
jgi:hypothetical protein